MEFAERAVQENLREQTAEARKVEPERGFQQGMEEGLEKGFEKGIEKVIEKGMEKALQKGMEKGSVEGLEKGKKILLKSLLLHTYGADDEWGEALADQQIEEALIHIPKCDTHEALKEKLGIKEI
ncbi:hypothetical protein MKC66_01260 [[Clostridium] innocuum]|nr:hypothetical protein [[Clostridium] innocuum]